MTLLASWFAWVLVFAAWVVVAVTIALPLGAMIKRRDRQIPTDHQTDQADQSDGSALVGPDPTRNTTQIRIT